MLFFFPLVAMHWVDEMWGSFFSRPQEGDFVPTVRFSAAFMLQSECRCKKKMDRKQKKKKELVRGYKYAWTDATRGRRGRGCPGLPLN